MGKAVYVVGHYCKKIVSLNSCYRTTALVCQVNIAGQSLPRLGTLTSKQ